MIHFRPEGTFLRIGLNLTRTRGGFVAIWAWYDFATRTGIVYRLRLRMHIKPHILWSKERFNVVDEHLWCNDLVSVSRTELADLRAAEDRRKSRDDGMTYYVPPK